MEREQHTLIRVEGESQERQHQLQLGVKTKPLSALSLSRET